ncbi:MAG: ABC transporter substrate-binding protein, partial [Candidatus Dormibacteraceae bacterium]
MSESRFDPLPLLHAPFLRRELLRRFALTGVGVASAPLLGTALQACGSSDSSGNLVAYAISRSPNVLNPPIHTLLIESTVFGLIFSGLVKPGQGGNFAPALAEDYQTLDGGMTYKFSLRQGLKFDDGQPLTAQDWKFTWQAYINPKTATSYLTGWDKIDQVETPDDRSVVIHMKQPYAAFMQNVATNPVLPQHILQADFNNLSKSSFNRQPVGCGAFRFKSWQTAAQITLEANQYYYQGRPKLDQFIFKIVPDSNTQINELQTGAVDLIDVTPAQWDKVKSLSGVNTSSYLDATANAMYYLIQLDEYDFLKEVKVRQALDYATPKQQFVTDLLKGLAEIAYTDQVPDSPYYNPNVEKHDYNLEKAKSLLSEAGFTMQNGTLSRDGKPLEVPLYVLKTNPELVQLAQVLKERWSSIGIKTEVIPQESATLFGQGGPFYNGQDGAV